MVLGTFDVDAGSVVGRAVLYPSVALLGGAVVSAAEAVLSGAMDCPSVAVLGKAMTGCSAQQLGDAAEGSPVVELEACDEGWLVVVLGGGMAGASVGIVGVMELLVVGVTVFGGPVELELGGSVEVRGAAVLVGGGGLQGKGWCCL